MKKLESLNNQKYILSDEELLKVGGGSALAIWPTADESYKYSTTNVGGNNTIDQEIIDVCFDW